MLNCKLCNKKIDERNAQEQCGFTLCHSCVDTNTDYELRELLWSLEVLEPARRKQMTIHLDENESEFLIDWLHEDLLLEKESDIADSMVVKTLESIINKLEGESK